MTNHLTDKQKRFVEEYLIDLNATQAAIRAGYSEKTAEQGAAQLLSNIKVQVAVAEAQSARSQRTRVTVDQIVNGLLTEAENTSEGSTHSARVAAWAHLGKHMGMFTDKIEMKSAISDLSEAELDRYIEILQAIVDEADSTGAVH